MTKIPFLCLVVTTLTAAAAQADDRQKVEHKLESSAQSGPILSGETQASIAVRAGEVLIDTSLGMGAGRAEIGDETIEYNQLSAKAGLSYPMLFPEARLGFMTSVGYSSTHEGYGELSLEDGGWSLSTALLWMPLQNFRVKAGVSWNPDETSVMPVLGFDWHTGPWMLELSVPGNLDLHYRVNPVFSPGLFAGFGGISIVRESSGENDADLSFVRTGVDFRFNFGENCSASVQSGAAVDRDEQDVYFFNTLGVELKY